MLKSILKLLFLFDRKAKIILMTTKEQRLTFDNINEFFAISEEIVDVISNNINNLNQQELIDRLDIVESFIEQITDYLEIITDDYTRLIAKQVKEEEKFRTEIKQQIVLMIITLNDCKDKLLARLADE